jgi:acyl-[acyl-carrier-protein] desaturase
MTNPSWDFPPAQDYLMQLPARIRKLAERAAMRKKKAKKSLVKFSWIFNTPLEV